MATFDEAVANLEAQVANDATVNQSAVDLILKVVALYEANKNSPAKIQELSDKLRSNSEALASAVLANTPAEDEPPADPPVE